MKSKMIEIENLKFPEDYIFSFKDPNGGTWLKKVSTEENIYRLGVSSLIAVKLEKIVKLNFLDLYKSKDKLIDNEIFLFLKGFNYEVNLFAPLDAKITKINPIIEECSEEHPVVLTQESVYDEHWLLEIETSQIENEWLIPSDKKFEKIIKAIVKADKVLQDRCCPNLFDSDVVRRLKK